MKKQNKDLYFDQEVLRKIQELLFQNLNDMLLALKIEFRYSGKMIVGNCPVHEGDNSTAWNLYIEELENGLKGNWICRSQHCEKECKDNLLGLIRGVKQFGKNWFKTVDWATEFLGIPIEQIKNDDSIVVIKKDWSVDAYLDREPQKQEGIFPRSLIRQRLKIPCNYYIGRGYSKSILDKYDVGLSSNGRFKGRAVVPIYNDEYTHAIGLTGRATWQDPKNKWIHTSGFRANHCLYNFWFAKEDIYKSKQVILVEGPGDVWKLEENGIHNSVAMFGTELSEEQMVILERSGALNIIVMTDNDKAGILSAQKIKEKCGRIFRLYFPKIKTDVGDMNTDDITKDIEPILNKAVSVI